MRKAVREWICTELNVSSTLKGFKEMVKFWESLGPEYEIADVKGPYGESQYLAFTFTKSIKKERKAS